jgi:quercetin dioxygenase-like cupin family protein
VTGAHDHHGVQVETLARATASWDGETLPAYPMGQPEVTLLRITIPPATQLPFHMHPVINVGLLLSGELTVVTEEGERLYLKAGDSIVELVGRWHYGHNEGTEAAEIVVFYAGVVGKPITVAKPDTPHSH